MKLEDLTVEVRDINLNRLGVIRPEELSFRMEDRFNNVGAWKLKLPAEHPMVEHLREPGSGIIVTGPLDVIMSGPTSKPEYQATPEDPMGTVSFEGVSDTVILADALSWPEPSNDNVSTQAEAHDVRTGPAESLLHDYVRVNIGPDAPASRRKANLTMGTDQMRGATLTKRPRFPVLGNLLTEIALTSNLGFRVVQRDDVLVFETYVLTDRTAEIRLDVGNDTLAGSRLAVSAPTATRIIVAGQGEQVERKFLQIDNADSIAAEAEWGRRIERFLDQRNTNEDNELTKAGEEVLAEEGFTAVAVQAVPVEDSSMRFGVDWGLGDRVTVVVHDTEYVSAVTGMAIIAEPNAFKVGAILGDPTKFDPEAALANRVTDTARRVGELERNMGTVNDLSAELETHVEATTDAHDASAISFVPSGDLTADNVQAAITELAEPAEELEIGTGSLSLFLDDHSVQAENSGAPGTLYLNPEGGDIHLFPEVSTANPDLIITGGNGGAFSQVRINTNQVRACESDGVTPRALYVNYGGGGVNIQSGASGAITQFGDNARLQGGTGYLHLNWHNSQPVAIGSGATTNRAGGTRWQVDGFLTVNGSGGAITMPNIGTNGSANVNITSGGVLSRTSSSARYKENISPLDWDVEQLVALEPRIYQRKDHYMRVPVPLTSEETTWEHVKAPITEETPWSPGFIAEEAQALGLGPWLMYWDDELDGFDYQAWTAAQQAILRHHHERIDELERKNADLEARLARLEALIPNDTTES